VSELSWWHFRWVDLLNIDAPSVDMGLKWDPEAGRSGIESAEPLIECED
jgi:hypothetical protein